MAALSTGAFAESVTFDFTSSSYGLPEYNADDNNSTEYVATPATIASEDGAVELTFTGGWRMWSDGIREYYKTANTGFSVASKAEGKVITSVSWDVVSGATFALAGTTDNITEWTGSASSVSFVTTATANKAVKSITIVYGDGTATDPNPGTQPDPETPDLPTEGVNTAIYTPSSMGYANQEKITSATVDGVSFVFSKGSGSTDPAYYNTGNALRLYGGNTMEVSVDLGNIVKVEFTFASGEGTNEITATPGTFTSLTWTGSAENVTFTIGGTSGHRRIASVAVTYVVDENSKQSAGLAFSEKEVNTTLTGEFTAPTLANPHNLAVTYTSSNTAVATVDANGNVTLVAAGTTTITATSAETEQYAAGQASYVLNVVNRVSVIDALELIEDGFTGIVQVEGYIVSITELSTSYGNATYVIADEMGEESDLLTVYRGYWKNGEKFTSTDQLKVGGYVAVEGALTTYNGQPQLNSGSKVIEYTTPEGGDEPDPDTPTAPEGTITVAEALALIAAGYSGEATVKGIISAITDMSNTDSGSTYGNATYTIVDALTDAKALTVFRGYWIDGEKFATGKEIAVGGTVVVTGNLKNYNGTPEFDSGNKVVSYVAPEGGEPTEPEGESVTFDFTQPSTLSDDLSDEGVATQEIILTGETFTSAPISLSFAATEGASNQPRLYYGSGGSAGWTFRFYKDNTFTVASSEGYHITSIVFEGSNITGLTLSSGSLAGTTWTADAAPTVDSVSFSKEASGNNPTIKKMIVYYAEGKAGISAVEADANAPVEYFNLQGVRVANPESGLYIRRQGNTATKVFVK